VKTHILTINEKKEKKKEGCMEKRAKNSKFKKHSSFLKKPRKKLPLRRLFHHTRTREEDAFIIARAHIITQQCHL
jgi:hypothetical protein